MVKKIAGKTRKIKNLDRYLGDVGVYDLSKPLKIGKGRKIDFLVVSKSRAAHGGTYVSAWESDVDGKILNTTPVVHSPNSEIKDVLHNLGYILF